MTAEATPSQGKKRLCSSSCKFVILFVFITAAVIVLWLGGIVFLLFVLLYSQRVASHSCETLTRAATSPKNSDNIASGL